MLLKRVRSNMNSHEIRDKSFIFGDENKCGKEFLKFMFNDRESSHGEKLYSYTLEDFAISVMKFFLFHDPPNKKIEQKNGFSPLFNVSENEVISFFKLKKRDVEKISRSGKDESVLKFLSEIEERRPGGMISLVKVGIKLGII